MTHPRYALLRERERFDDRRGSEGLHVDCSASTGDNACAEKAAQGGSTADRDACLTKRASCKDTGAKTFDDDTCALLPALKAAAARDIMACVQQGCDLIARCIKNVGEQIPGCD